MKAFCHYLAFPANSNSGVGTKAGTLIHHFLSARTPTKAESSSIIL